jgi:hypothetical protein
VGNVVVAWDHFFTPYALSLTSSSVDDLAIGSSRQQALLTQTGSVQKQVLHEVSTGLQAQQRGIIMSTIAPTHFDELVQFAADNAQALVAKALTNGDPVPLDDQDSPPWLEPNVVTELDQEFFARTVTYHCQQCVTRPNGQEYCVCGDNDRPVRIFWKSPEGQYLGLELQGPDALFEEMVEDHDAECYKNAMRLARELQEWLDWGGPPPVNHDYGVVLDTIGRCLNPY